MCAHNFYSERGEERIANDRSRHAYASLHSTLLHRHQYVHILCVCVRAFLDFEEACGRSNYLLMDASIDRYAARKL
jgi:hypothetical protein